MPMRSGDIERHSGTDLRWNEAASDDVFQTYNASPSRARKNQPQLTFGTLQLPFTKRAQHDGRQGNGPFARTRLRPPKLLVLVSAFPDMDFALGEIDVRPAQTSQLRGAQPRED